MPSSALFKKTSVWSSFWYGRSQSASTTKARHRSALDKDTQLLPIRVPPSFFSKFQSICRSQDEWGIGSGACLPERVVVSWSPERPFFRRPRTSECRPHRWWNMRCTERHLGRLAYQKAFNSRNFSTNMEDIVHGAKSVRPGRRPPPSCSHLLFIDGPLWAKVHRQATICFRAL